jgi:glycosyltransferase involved in cell wall biosynthesis
VTAPPTRRLYLDIQATQDPFNAERGIPRYAAMHAAALVERPGTVSRLALSPFLGAPRSLPARHRASPLLCWNTAAELSRARREGPIAYHLMSPLHVGPSLEASFPFAALTPDDALVVTMYDAVPLLEPREYLHTRSAAASVRSRLDVLRSADLVLTLSRNGVAELVELLDLDPSRVAWIGGGVDPYFSPTAERDASTALVADAVPDLRRPFVMSVTHHYERKNTGLLLRAFALLPTSLRDNLQVVLVGDLEEPWRERLRETARLAGIRDEAIVLTGRVSDESLRALYRGARLFVAPSLSEGWGLPVAEAIACGCPAITSNTSALPEVLDFPPSTFDPRDPAALAVLMERALDVPAFRAELRAAGEARAAEHTWPVVAERTAGALAQLEARERRRGPRRSRPTRTTLRLAYAGRVDARGVAEDRYGAELLTRLAAHADVDVYVPGDVPVAPADAPAGASGRFPLAALGTTRNPYAYDVVVHSLGRSSEARDHLRAAARAPGFVWLHDAGLALPAPAPPHPPGRLVPLEHRPRPNRDLTAAAQLVLVDWKADRHLLGLARAAGDVPVVSLPLGVERAGPGAPTGGSVAIVLGDAPDDSFVTGWLDALLHPEATRRRLGATLVGSTTAVSQLAAREPGAVGAQPVVDLVGIREQHELVDVLARARVVVDATTDGCSATMLARASLATGRRLVTRRASMAEVGAAFVRVVDEGDDPLDVALTEARLPAPPAYTVSVDDVVAKLLEVIDRWRFGSSAA